MADSARRLSSWKEIAAHFGRDVRTVMRWEKERALPVHRGSTGKSCVVFADMDELDAWTRGYPGATEAPLTVAQPAPAVRPVRRLRTAAAAVLAIAVALVGWAMHVSKPDGERSTPSS